jgi:hypothetical protein
MAGSKFEKYILREPWGIPNKANPDPDAPVYIGIGQGAPVKGWDESMSQVLRPIYKPYLMIPKAHVHSCAEILYFIGGNPMNFRISGAEVELVMGEGEQAEKYTITLLPGFTSPKPAALSP